MSEFGVGQQVKVEHGIDRVREEGPVVIGSLPEYVGDTKGNGMRATLGYLHAKWGRVRDWLGGGEARQKELMAEEEVEENRKRVFVEEIGNNFTDTEYGEGTEPVTMVLGHGIGRDRFVFQDLMRGLDAVGIRGASLTFGEHGRRFTNQRHGIGRNEYDGPFMRVIDKEAIEGERLVRTRCALLEALIEGQGGEVPEGRVADEARLRALLVLALGGSEEKARERLGEEALVLDDLSQLRTVLVGQDANFGTLAIQWAEAMIQEGIKGRVITVGQSLGGLEAVRMTGDAKIREALAGAGIEIVGMVAASAPLRQANERKSRLMGMAIQAGRQVITREGWGRAQEALVAGMKIMLGAEDFDYRPGSMEELMIGTPADVLLSCYFETFGYKDWEKWVRQVPREVQFISTIGGKDKFVQMGGWRSPLEAADYVVVDPIRGHEIPPLALLRRYFYTMANRVEERKAEVGMEDKNLDLMERLVKLMVEKQEMGELSLEQVKEMARMVEEQLPPRATGAQRETLVEAFGEFFPEFRVTEDIEPEGLQS